MLYCTVHETFHVTTAWIEIEGVLIVLGVVLIAVSVLIVVFTLAQEQKGQGLSGAIMGESSATMAAGRERGVDAKLAKLTKWVAIGFVVITFVMCLL